MYEYHELIADVPRPTPEQSHAFACFVANDQSWYKKLPMIGWGEPFFVYLHPAPHAVQVEAHNGGWAWRPIVREAGEPTWFPRWAIGFEPGDIEPRLPPLNYIARGMSTAEYVARLGHWGYWNWGPSDQSRAEALDQARAGLRVANRSGVSVVVPEVALELGLVYLRATVGGEMGPMTDEYEQLRVDHGLPSVAEDCLAQIDEMVAAMTRVVAWAYDK